MGKNKWIIDDDFELSEEPLSIEEMIEVRERHKKYGIDDGISDEEFNKKIEELRIKEK